MLTINSERIIPCDVDNTLILHGSSNPLLRDVLVPCKLGDGMIKLKINEPMVRLLREEKQRGAYIIVWSRGGYQWAEDVVTALGIENIVDLVLSKPLVYFDDKPVNEWLLDRVYLTPDTPYKNQITKE